MTSQVVIPNSPVITSITPTTFVGTPGFLVKGTEDISNIPSGYSVKIDIFDQSTGGAVVGGPTTTNSDGSWQILIAADSGDLIYAMALTVRPDGSPGATSHPSLTVVVPQRN
ncbi:hypothetical protein [uncultured Martelella sp.]|uniref:hypothetical protein n=1 Tax=uncultured Martelella sp. TaxID=392331 RepID=UPI0029C69EC3|nr:hypothetical protein [uncultured Martelella sp.]